MSRTPLLSVTKQDLHIDYFSGKGAGGQHRNKHQNCVRLRHNDSGALATGQSHRERRSNMRESLHNLADHPKFKLWLSIRTNEIIDNKTIEEKVEAMMVASNMRIEVKDNHGRWIDDTS